jgi:hypothetical protein
LITLATWAAKPTSDGRVTGFPAVDKSVSGDDSHFVEILKMIQAGQ